MATPQQSVLVVDDEPSLRLLCRVNLEIEGYRVLEAATVEAAHDLLARETIDVVLLDMHIGSGSGLEVLAAIEEQGLPVRIIVLSGTSEITPELRARAHSVLGKPFGLAELAAAVAGR